MASSEERLAAEVAALESALDRELCTLTMGLRSDEVVAYWKARRPWQGPSNAEVEANLLCAVATHIRARGAAKPGIALSPMPHVSRGSGQSQSTLLARDRMRFKTSTPVGW